MAYVARPLNCDAAFDTSKLAGKTAVITGGMYINPRFISATIGELSLLY